MVRALGATFRTACILTLSRSFVHILSITQPATQFPSQFLTTPESLTRSKSRDLIRVPDGAPPVQSKCFMGLQTAAKRNPHPRN